MTSTLTTTTTTPTTTTTMTTTTPMAAATSLGVLVRGMQIIVRVQLLSLIYRVCGC